MSGPTHRVYTVIKREGKDDYWLNLGVAFAHEDGEGFKSSSAGVTHRRQNRAPDLQG